MSRALFAPPIVATSRGPHANVPRRIRVRCIRNAVRCAFGRRARRTARAMLEPLARSTGLDDVIDGVMSVDDAGIYKPSPRVYQLAVDRLGLAPAQIAFVSSNGWDAAGAKAFGFTTFWINRDLLPTERH